MKATRLTIKNVGLVADADIVFDHPLLLFYGNIQQGKTTLLNAVKWVFGGSFPSDIIRTGESEAMVRLTLDCGHIERQWYRARNGETKSRPVIFEKNGAPVANPVAEIKKFLNPFLLDQDYLRNMTELERKKYFAATFAIDTRELDLNILAKEAKAQEVRAKLKGYGDIDLSPVARPEGLGELQARRKEIIDTHQANVRAAHDEVAKRRFAYDKQIEAMNLDNSCIREHNYQIESRMKRVTLLFSEINQLKAEITRLTEKCATAQNEFAKLQEWLAQNDPKPLLAPPAPPAMSDLLAILEAQPVTAEVDGAISKCFADQVRYEQYQANQVRASKRARDEVEIEALDAEVRELRKNKIAKLKQSSDATGIAGLEFDEAGNFRFEGSEAGMLSTSQIMRLSSLLSAKYPPGFGVDLIDRAESLGKSILDFVTRAQHENKTILAAIVGERPAAAPAEVGVFVVEKGVVS
jgi:hypothetical protein